MAQDLRDLFKDQPKEKDIKMSDGHEVRFLKKLNNELPVKGKGSYFNFLNIAASVVILLGLSYGAFKVYESPEGPTETTEMVNTDIKSLGDISPDFKKVEDYYLASINLELSKVKLTPQNKELFDGYILRLKELNDEYDKLTIELKENGPNEDTLDALIANLKFRLNLVMRLKEKLAEYNDDSYLKASA